MNRERTARAFWTTAPGHGELREQALAEPATGEVLVRARYSGISRGSESLVFSGRVPESEYERMRAPFQQGEFPFPVCYGYASVGEVEAGSASLVGRPVFCLHPHQDRYVVPASMVVPLPDDVPMARAVLAANLETAVNAVWDGAPGPGDRIAVIGGGVVGLLVGALAAAIPGCSVTVVDIDSKRRAPAEALGMAFAEPVDAPENCDLVFHASGRAEGLDTALRCAGLEACIVEMSWYGDAVVPLRLGEAFHARRLVLRSSQVGHVPPGRRPRWTRRRRLETALSLLADKRFDTLITGESGFDELPELMPRLAAGEIDALCHRIRY
ncbi:MAG: dehydrogenase [Xanthomonadales bacterium]|nr:dehydrogenase [Xanthomonadales bacterium]